LTHRDRSEYKTDSSVMAVCKPVTIPGMTGHVRRNTQEKGESLGYRAAYMGEDTYQGTHYWYGDLVKETVLDLHIINQQNSLMLKLADQFNADYDGWGTPIIK